MKSVFFLTLLLLSLSISAQRNSPQAVWLDADTGNEMDDLYAIVRLVKEPGIRIVGLSSAHFNNADLFVYEKWNGYQTKGLVTVAESQQLNEQILQALGRMDIPHPLGADRMIGRAWGGEQPRDNPASRAIIEAARALPPGEYLHVLTLGPLTNMASALLLDSSIKSRIKCWALGAKYNPGRKVWNKTEFNIRNDLNAFDYLLNLNGFELTIMPLDASLPLQFKREETYEKLNERIAIEKILEDRWKEHNPQDPTRVMWDLALVEAYLRPDLAQQTTANTPPENLQRSVQVYTKIDEAAMTLDFWKIIRQ
jgi:inosine-uridine nucleoside N-ribohydrolase